MYKKGEKQWPVGICLEADPDKSTDLGYGQKKKGIWVGIRLLDEIRRESNNNSFILGFNWGIHECTHLLRYINYADERNILSEMATYYTQTKHGLPLESKSIKCNYLGHVRVLDYNEGLSGSKRDFVHLLDEIRRGTLGLEMVDLKAEYLAFMVGPWVRDYLETRGEFDIFKFWVEGKEYVDLKGYLIGWSHGHFELRIDDFCSASGITDQGLISELTKAFDRINKEQCKNADSFFESFERNMNEVFGRPKSDVPDGFVHHEKKVTPESVPKKVKNA